MKKPLLLTELVLRDANQSLLATRLRTEDMLPIAPKLDAFGFWSVESWAVRHSTLAFATSARIRGSVCGN